MSRQSLSRTTTSVGRNASWPAGRRVRLRMHRISSVSPMVRITSFGRLTDSGACRCHNKNITGNPMTTRRLLLLLLAAAAIAAFFAFDLGRYLSLDALKARQEALQAYAAANPLQSAAIFFGVYVGATALSIPGAAVLTLAAGAVFGLWRGLLIVSFASAIGATLAFL